ncbi:DUF4124 domain-containing protein [Marinobacter orientalis]|uniref:DUF4124 domain-containing protein n=1 Tax=Marinobacter orientalis TaxID=1928859 RepID=A0A7Y0RAS4_9GAMM|nr:DUF4124 domain-containing protein [Marinobacter orientalis]NMT62203.1 DUF4124 domain-containing protein [Marinobacter orientalis]TGX50919.1 DUF4124 domain-containing protein [Marinobacter orientalis]
MPWRQAAVFVSVFIPAVSVAEVYRWIDDQGVAHFSDRKPSEGEHEQVELNRPSLVPMRENITRGKRVSAISEQVNRSLQAGNGRQPSGKPEARARERNNARCQGYRQKLERIHQQLRAGYSNDQGNRLRRKRREVSQKLSRQCLLD